MTVRRGKAEWHDGVKCASGTSAVGGDPFECDDAEATKPDRPVPQAVARIPLSLVLEYLRSHDRLAEPGSARQGPQEPEFVVRQRTRSRYEIQHAQAH